MLTAATIEHPNAKGGPANPATVQSPQKLADNTPPKSTPLPAQTQAGSGTRPGGVHSRAGRNSFDGSTIRKRG